MPLSENRETGVSETSLSRRRQRLSAALIGQSETSRAEGDKR